LLAQGELSVEFGDRAFGVRDELDELARGVACLAFGDIGGNGDRGATHLRNEAKLFVRRQLLCENVDLAREGKSHVTRFYLSDQIEPSP